MRGLAGQESGNPNAVNPDTGAHGAWQVMPANWSKWAKAAGLAPDAPKTLDNQRIVVRHQLVGYFIAWGSWDNAARAWYAGPGRHAFHSEHQEGKYPSVNAYARSVLAKVGPLPC
jgi:hypothetical protein